MEESRERDKNRKEVKEILEELDRGVDEFFSSERYNQILDTMAKLHTYSINNSVLITKQFPGATMLAGYQQWQQKWGRQVKKGEKGIRILAPQTYTVKYKKEKLNPDTGMIIRDANNQPVTEIVEERRMKFVDAYVFDVSQTYGKEILDIGVKRLDGMVEEFGRFMDVLLEVSQIPVKFEPMSGTVNGYCTASHIGIREGMSERQTIKTLIHEMGHNKIHFATNVTEGEKTKDRATREMEAESVAYVVCSHFGIDTSEYSFEYVARWSEGKTTQERRRSLEAIRGAASELIETIEKGLERQQQLEKLQMQERITVAVESTDDYQDFNIGFTTFQLGEDLRLKYRLVRIGDDGRLEAFPEKGMYFNSQEMLKKYISAHKDEFDVISYDNMVHKAESAIVQFKSEVGVIPEIYPGTEKRYRNQEGRLSVWIDDLCDLTIEEAKKYYLAPNVKGYYFLGTPHTIYEKAAMDENLLHLKSRDGSKMAVPVDDLGTFLPDVSKIGCEMYAITDQNDKFFECVQGLSVGEDAGELAEKYGEKRVKYAEKFKDRLAAVKKEDLHPETEETKDMPERKDGQILEQQIKKQRQGR